MATKPRKIQHRRSEGLKSKRQQRTRRKNNLFLKSFEFCKVCDADIILMVRLKHNGQISVFNSDSQWNPSQEELYITQNRNE
ncbi:uncharacterized protein LDX57_009346 [Aspergillus melleus]|uniref:uncharacterized protein n=1 Tax=Aspergillus melleus TaxID=138277 RepID=UPI001E8EA042|nr:uncharacterized protein LDX57_009346 [Aspergillus melleus]KAH8431692.1 hypothetical protein LDX57_009346 [Aspergillus melleus]